MARIVTTGYAIPLAALMTLVACGGDGLVRKNELMELEAAAAKAYAAEDWQGAEKYFKALTERLPGEGEYWFRLGNIQARLHRPEEAVAAYKEALLRQNVKSKSWHNMGIVYLRQAANAFTQMLTDTDPQDPLYQRAAALNEAVLNILNGIDADVARPATPE